MIGRAFSAAACALTVAGTAAVAIALESPQARRSQGPDSVCTLPSTRRRSGARGTGVCRLPRSRKTVRLRAAAPRWEALVLDMGARGATIEIDDVDPMVRYLSTVFGPKAPPFVDVNPASKAELTQLPGVAPDAADRLIAARSAAPLSSAEQVQAAFGLDETAFQKIKYYVYVNSSPPARNR